MNDLISRQAAIEALGERPMVWVGSDYELGARNQYDADVLALETVPSAQPETHDKRTEKHACDLIDRQAAIDAIDRLDIPEDMCVFEILSHIELEIGNLPSAQPERKRGQ